jgi:hypothetical protein
MCFISGLPLLSWLGNSGGDGDGEETGEFNCTSNSVIFFCMSNQSAIQKQLGVSKSRQSAHDRLLIQQQQKIDTLLVITRRQQTPAHVPFTPSSPPRTPTLMPRRFRIYDRKDPSVTVCCVDVEVRELARYM